MKKRMTPSSRSEKMNKFEDLISLNIKKKFWKKLFPMNLNEFTCRIMF